MKRQKKVRTILIIAGACVLAAMILFRTHKKNNDFLG
jgi:hypothetical protein